MTTAMNLMRPRRNGNSLTAGDVEVGVDADADADADVDAEQRATRETLVQAVDQTTRTGLDRMVVRRMRTRWAISPLRMQSRLP